MKKILFLLISIPLIFNSCEKEEENPSNNNNLNTSSSIIGTWEIEHYTEIDEFGVVENITNIETITSTNENVGPEEGERWFCTVGDTSMIFYGYYNNIMTGMDIREYTKDGNIYYFEDVQGGYLTLTHLTNTNLDYNHMDLEMYDNISSNPDIPEIVFYRTTFIGTMKKSELP